VSKAEDFEAKAVECDILATQAKDLEAKRMFREAAVRWLTKLAGMDGRASLNLPAM
jgi:hypothetical protein